MTDTCGLTGGKCRKESETDPGKLSTYTFRFVMPLWTAIQSQWRMGFSGPTGLDYTAVSAVANSMKIDLDERLLKHIQALERAQLKYFSDEQKKESEKNTRK